eukprot:9011283-Lingulodinium_polyedra.AAC.1
MAGRAPEVLFPTAVVTTRRRWIAHSCPPFLWSAGTAVAALRVGQRLFEERGVKNHSQVVVDFLGPPVDA